MIHAASSSAHVYNVALLYPHRLRRGIGGNQVPVEFEHEPPPPASLGELFPLGAGVHVVDDLRGRAQGRRRCASGK